ncbi:hypothetical protein CC80DRAFT_502974 [Byssothecium circinans]|uniref:Uncharacterized protein n=1 Tax=Byssothecium circinans TaxID=147558 RepID=A0A6A5U2X0_9PLEO|nr:hypothetical protein CC80DRAFT_502974 [Byssothecium circinans]
MAANAPAPTLWSKIASKPKPEPASPAVQTPTSPRLTAVLKTSMSVNGGSTCPISTTPRGKFNWADDEDDEDDFPAMPVAAPSHDVPTNNVITQLHQRIQELEHTEAELADSDAKVVLLECTVDDLEQQLREKQLLVERYVEQVADKDRHIAELEQELDTKARDAYELQTKLDELSSSPAPDSESESATLADIETKETVTVDSDTSHATNDIPALPSSKQEKAATEPANASASLRTSPMSEPETTEVAPNAPSTKSFEPVFKADDFPTMSPPKSIDGSPAPRDHSEPVFATVETIKKSEPVPPPPKLKLGIDTSKFGKKTTADVRMPNASRAGYLRPKSNVVPEIKPDIDIRRMTQAERFPFGNGPAVTLKLGNEVLGQVPKYMLAQVSHTAFNQWKSNPNATSITFPASSMNTEAAIKHIQWMNDLTRSERVFSVHLDMNEDDRKHRENLEVVRAARVMGINNIYIGHFTKHYCEKIRNNALSHALMSHIVEVAYPANDPIYDCLANNLVLQRIRRTIPDAASFEKFLEDHKDLAKKMDTIQARKAAPRKDGRAPGRKGPSSRGSSVVSSA